MSFTLSNRVELATRLIAAVPAFPDASVDELIDLRSRLSGSLVRFRAAIAELEDELNADVVDEDFDRAVEDLRLRQVEPALEELRERLDEEGAGRALLRAVPSMAASTLAVGAAAAVSAPSLAAMAAVVAGGATATAKEALERHRLADERKRHRLFVLFETERRLAL